MVDDLTEEQRATIRSILDGLLRERSRGSAPAVRHNAVNLGSGFR